MVKTLSRDLQEEITRRLVEELQPEQIFLFGSHAWGTPTEDSDIDLLVIVPKATESSLDLAVRARRSLRGLGVPKDVLVRTRAQFEQAASVYASLESEVRERGTVLYG